MTFEIHVAGLEDRPLLKTLIAGPAGAGKSRFCATAPNCLAASCESRMLSYADKKRPYVTIESGKDMDEVITALRQPIEVREKLFGAPIDTFVVDTIDGFQTTLKGERTRKNGGTFLRDDWGWLKDEMTSVTKSIMTLPLHVIFVVHIAESRDDETGRIYFTPALEGAFKGQIASYFDIVGIVKAITKTTPTPQGAVKSIERTLQLFPEPANDWVKDSLGKLGNEFKLNLEDDFQRMHDTVFAGWKEAAEEKAKELEHERSEGLARMQALTEVLDAAVTPVVEAEEVVPDVLVETPARTVSYETISSSGEVVNSEQFGLLTTPFNDILDPKEKLTAKNEFVAKFGSPMTVPLDKYDSALKWVTKRVAGHVPAPLDPVPAPEPEVEVPEPKVRKPRKAKETTPAPEGPQVCKKCGTDVEDADVIALCDLLGLDTYCEEHLKEINNS